MCRAPDSWVDDEKTQVGCEISFTKYFYEPERLRGIDEILGELMELERESNGGFVEIMEGIENV